ncbi:hypothetical protein [Streptomyces sp. NPDC051546]|uniref:hypothetical protein n=1 Tax=Streptomyces sp. NPDC051546 TaxID=3365655 RepID=UPI0037B929AD
MQIPDDLEFLDVLGVAPEQTEEDQDIWRVDVPIDDSNIVTLSFDVGARSVRLAKGPEAEPEVDIYRERVERILLYSRNGERGIIVECDVPGFRCELRVVISPAFRLTDPMLYVG